MDVIVVGGGPAGMMAAIEAAKNNNQVILLEKNEKLGKKLFITGKGRGNVTNACDNEVLLNNIVTNKKFMYSSLSKFGPKEIMDFLEEYGCELKIERGNRVFPKTDKAYSITDALKKALKEYNVEVVLNTNVISIKKENDIFLIDSIVNGNNKIWTCKKIIIATGGLSYPSTGSTGDGYFFAKNFKHEVTKTYPALVGLETKQLCINNNKSKNVSELQGLSLKNVKIKLYNKNNPQKIIYEDFGEMLFTHYGVSGPLIISASSFVTSYENLNDFRIDIDLKPALSYEELDIRVLKDFEKYKNKELKNSLIDLLPHSLIPSVIYKLNHILQNKDGIENKKCCDITKEERKVLISILKAYKIALIKTRPFEEAIITQGGVSIKQIDSKTMESKLVKNLFFAGEVLDIDCLTGGFNLTIAFSTGYTAGQN